MAKQVNVPLADKSDSARSARMWSKLTKRSVSTSEAKDLDLAFSGGPAESNLGAEPMSPIQDNNEESMVSRSQQPNRARTRPLARGAMRSSTNRFPLAR
jgi:hypothetical protein